MGEMESTDPRIPTRKEIELRHLSKYACQTSIIQLGDDGEVSYRVSSGMLDNAIIGHCSDRSLGRFYTDEARIRVKDWFRRLMRQPCGGHLSVGVVTRDGKPATLEVLALPMNNDAGEIKYLITANHIEYNRSEDAYAGVRQISLDDIKFSENVDLGWGVPSEGL